MPPKRKIKKPTPIAVVKGEDVDDGYDLCMNCSHDETVAMHIQGLMPLPTDTVLAVVVGTCARLQVQMATLTHSHSPDDITQDCLRVCQSARHELRKALIELLAAESVFMLKEERLTDMSSD